MKILHFEVRVSNSCIQSMYRAPHNMSFTPCIPLITITILPTSIPFPPVAKVISEGAGEWTTDTRRRNLRGLEVVIKLAGGAVESIVPQLLACLSGPIRDEDPLVCPYMIQHAQT